MTTTVYLQGNMGDRFGRVHQVAHSSYADIMKTINANHPDFRKYLFDLMDSNIGLDVNIQGESVTEIDQYLYPFEEGDVIITPVPVGDYGSGKVSDAVSDTFEDVTDFIGDYGGDILKVGAVVAGAAFVGPALMSGLGSLTTTMGGMLGNMISGGISGLISNYLYSGAMSLIYDALSGDSGGAGPEADNVESNNYIYQGGNVSTWREGQPLPVIYGELRVPGFTVGVNTDNNRHLHQPMIPSFFGDMDYYSKGGN